MSNEELNQRGYLATGKLIGNNFGDFEELNIGATSVQELRAAGVDIIIPAAVDYPFSLYKAVKNPGLAKPDRVFLRRQDGKLKAVATAEHKAPTKLRSAPELLKAAEQGLFAASSLGATVAVTSNGTNWLYIDVAKSLSEQKIAYLLDKRDFGPGVLTNLLAGDAGTSKDPAPLAEKVWQTIWHATKEEPKQCLLTFVEIFMLKFLSDNLPLKTLPEAYRFYGLLVDPKIFQEQHGITSIEYYVSDTSFYQESFPRQHRRR
jgi:type I restriction enzyme M protein